MTALASARSWASRAARWWRRVPGRVLEWGVLMATGLPSLPPARVEAYRENLRERCPTCGRVDDQGDV